MSNIFAGYPGRNRSYASAITPKLSARLDTPGILTRSAPPMPGLFTRLARGSARLARAGWWRPAGKPYHRLMSEEPFVPEDFAVPDGPIVAEFRLIPLGPQHNEADYAAWMASIDHIRSTPGFGGRSWPHQMSLDDNLRDLEQHAQDFAARRGFTYTVLSTDTGDVIGCVYIYPPRGQGLGGSAGNQRHASVRSWVRADHAALDPVLHDVVLAWLERVWPFHSIEYAPRT